MAKLKYRTLALRDKRRLLAFRVVCAGSRRYYLDAFTEFGAGKNRRQQLRCRRLCAQQLPAVSLTWCKKVKPAVVNISTTGQSSQPGGSSSVAPRSLN